MELLHHPNPTVLRLTEYLTLLVKGTTEKRTYDSYADILETATPFEVNSALDAVLSKAEDVTSLTTATARFIRSLGKALESYPLPAYPQGSLLAELEKENEAIGAMTRKLQEEGRKLQKGMGTDVSVLKGLVSSFTLVREHYVRLQNELFPLFEQSTAEHACVKLMWSIQDTALSFQKAVASFTADDIAAFWKVYSQFYFHVEVLRYREHYILFPVAFRSLAPNEQARENPALRGVFSTITGSLDQQELEQIFSVLPLDIAFIDRDDRVKFYSDPPHRIFPRSPQVIGRLVQNCHPPKSVGTVQAILDSFKEGREDTAEFYLHMQGKFVHIQYYAVRSMDGSYLGTLEVTQDATHLRNLSGEKRLL
ncbi:MAG: PAS domain-containing protein [Sphaerochaeta sp.]|nr:PAS domain-containing protein [Sphaerochaeta sp.]